MRFGLEKLQRAAERDRSADAASPEVAAAWARLRPVAFEDRALARARIVTRDKRGPTHAPFDMLRTRLLRVLHDHGWRTVAITSPTPGCGKTTACLNLAFSFARRRSGRTLLIELDLVRPQMAALLRVRPERPINDALTGRAPIESCLLRYNDRLALGIAAPSPGDSAEILHGPDCAEALLQAAAAFAPDVILCDLPPLLAVDDGLGFAAKADGALLIAAEGESTLAQIDASVAQLSRTTEFLGVVLNKSAFPSRASPYGHYGYYG
jgi:Mrp family chromosome partitioning ATPase